MILSWIGSVMGIAAILLGQVLEGGHVSSIVQPTAALIVLGGTLGATLLSASGFPEFLTAIKGGIRIFTGGSKPLDPVIKEIVGVATSARKEGLLSLEKFVKDIKNPFFSENLRHIVDGYDSHVMQEMMEERIHKEEEEKNSAAKLWETAGGYAPTVGILGAVLGLIHVMENLSDSSKLGAGIAVAFVATVYGVGMANLLLIPIGNKLKKVLKNDILEMELIMTGLLGIQAGLNPRIIEDRLRNLLVNEGHGSKEDAASGAAEKKAA